MRMWDPRPGGCSMNSIASRQRPLSHIKGGNDLLPRAFATRLERRLRYGSPVIAIGQDDTSAWVVIQRRGERQLIRGQHVVCAAPFSVVRKMFSEARLARDKQELIGAQEYTPSTKVFLQTRSNFWRREGLSGFAYTDLPLERLWALDRDGWPLPTHRIHGVEGRLKARRDEAVGTS